MSFHQITTSKCSMSYFSKHFVWKWSVDIGCIFTCNFNVFLICDFSTSENGYIAATLSKNFRQSGFRSLLLCSQESSSSDELSWLKLTAGSSRCSSSPTINLIQLSLFESSFPISNRLFSKKSVRNSTKYLTRCSGVSSATMGRTRLKHRTVSSP